jgi:uncharacterized protein (DUF1786 family)
MFFLNVPETGSVFDIRFNREECSYSVVLITGHGCHCVDVMSVKTGSSVEQTDRRKTENAEM